MHLPDEADSIISDCLGEAKVQLKQEGETFDSVRHVGTPFTINPKKVMSLNLLICTCWLVTCEFKKKLMLLF